MLLRRVSSFLTLSTISPNLETKTFSASKLKQVRGEVSCESVRRRSFKYIEIEGLNGYIDFQRLFCATRLCRNLELRIRAGLNPPGDAWAKRASKG